MAAQAPRRAKQGNRMARGLREAIFCHFGKIVGAVVFLIPCVIALVRCERGQIPAVLGAVFGDRIFAWFGWIVAAIAVLAALVIYKMKDAQHEKEMNRLVDERNSLQEKLLGRNVQHSGDIQAGGMQE